MRKQIIAALMLFTSLCVASDAEEWQMLPKESELSFSATQNGAPVSGKFTGFAAKIFFNENNLDNSSVEVSVDMNSVQASYAELKSTLVTKDWFDAKEFPKAHFKASEWKRIGDHYQAVGAVTIRGKSLPLTLTFTLQKNADNKMTAIGSTVIKRNQFGIGQGEWAKTDSVKDAVSVHFKIVAVKKPVVVQSKT